MTRDSLVVTHCRHALRGAKTTPLSLKGWRFGTPCASTRHANDTFDLRAIFGVPKIKLKSIASVASDNKDEMYIPDDPKQVEKHLRNKGAPFWHPLPKGCHYGTPWHVLVYIYIYIYVCIVLYSDMNMITNIGFVRESCQFTTAAIALLEHGRLHLELTPWSKRYHRWCGDVAGLNHVESVSKQLM